MIVDQATYCASCWVERGVDPGSDWAKSVKAFAARPLAVALLQITRRDIVGQCVTKDDIQGIRFTQIAPALANNHGQLTFVVNTLADLGIDNRVARSDQRCRWLEKNQRLGWHFIAQLGGMFCVVATDTDNLARLHWRQQLYIVQCNGGASNARRNQIPLALR